MYFYKYLMKIIIFFFNSDTNYTDTWRLHEGWSFRTWTHGGVMEATCVFILNAPYWALDDYKD